MPLSALYVLTLIILLDCTIITSILQMWKLTQVRFCNLPRTPEHVNGAWIKLQLSSSEDVLLDTFLILFHGKI